MPSIPAVSARTTGASVAPGSPALTDVATRICSAVVDVVADQGLRATSIDDIAVAAGCGRATVYRAFPGGRAELLLTVLDREVAGIFELGTVAVRACSDFTDAVTAAIHTADLPCPTDFHLSFQHIRPCGKTSLPQLNAT